MGTFIVQITQYFERVLKGVLKSLKTTHRFNATNSVERILVSKYYRKFH